MDKTILLSAGINYQSGVVRFGGQEQLFEKYLKKFITDREFAGLCAAMEEEDYETAFKSAHTLKGMIGNLSIDGLFEILAPLVEMLRGKSDIAGAQKQFLLLKTEYEAVIESLEHYFK